MEAEGVGGQRMEGGGEGGSMRTDDIVWGPLNRPLELLIQTNEFPFLVYLFKLVGAVFF